MANDKTIAQNKAEGIKLSQTATGRTLSIVPAGLHSLFRLAYVDGKSGGFPEKYAGKYTSYKNAKEALDNFVAETWDVAEESTKKRKNAA